MNSPGFGGRRAGVTPRLVLTMIVLACWPAVAKAAAPAARFEKPLALVSNPPPVQMLVPGFVVRELPLDLNNINNLVFAPDSRLFALGYDGNVWQLKDRDGDGLEDAATPFYRNDQNEIPPSIGMCWGPGGLYIASQGRVIRLRDRGDGTAALETVTGGWVKPTAAAGSNLDAIGIAADAQGNIFFGLGCDNWNEAYRINRQTGKPEYNVRSERGTILKISPDWKTREIICTGMRFPVGLAFNAAGDLFCTDQEGATWLPNGNPFDELIHVQPGRHYGFPPRHPQHLPDVIDEPSVYDYAPQHQSTCGLHFNEPVAGGRTFGPPWWRGDALVTGQSRGKLWRTKLAKTAAGYVAKTDLIACISMLAIDAVPTPQGDLLLACHSGKPDWGTGPRGQGKLFRISYAASITPQPVLAHAESSTRTRIVFDRPLANTGGDLAKESKVATGKYVTAGERFESFRPGYQVIKIQRTMPRFELPVTSARVSEDKRSVVIETPARTEAVNCAVTLPGSIVGSAHDVDLLVDLTGAEATWQAANGTSVEKLWLPHLDLAVARGFTAASAEHARFFQLAGQRGTMTLRAQLDLHSMLHPAVQPESKLSYEYPPEIVTVAFKAKERLTVTTPSNVIRVNNREVHVTLERGRSAWWPVEVTLATGEGDPVLEVSWFTAEDRRRRALPLHRVLLPWATPHVPVALVSHTPELEGGDWERGRKVFFSEQAACFKCHQVAGEGGDIGPNLSNLIYRDYASVLKDITEPSAAINPEHIGFTVQLKDGDVESGVVLQNERRQLVLGQANGQSLTIAREKVADMKASAVSIMPEGLLQTLDARQQKDLMTYLLTPPPKERSRR